MAFITLTGNLLDPGGFLAIGDQVRFTHKSSTGSTIKSSVNVITIPNSGNYSITLQYGLVKVDYKDSSSNTFTNLGVVTVNPDNLSTTLPELLNAVVPPSSQEMIEFQTILAECKTQANSATDSATEAANIAASINLENTINPRYLSQYDYTKGTVLTASDGVEYLCLKNNGPNSVIVDPVTENIDREYWQNTTRKNSKLNVADRPPTRLDNKGFGGNAVWIYQDDIYTSNRLSPGNYATWAKDLGRYSRAPQPIKPPQALWWAKKIVESYSGPCFNIENEDTGISIDIGFDYKGDLDYQAMTGHLFNSRGLINTWYDQSGNGNDLTSSGVNRPVISSVRVVGDCFAVIFETSVIYNGQQTPNQYLEIPSTLVGNSNDLSVCVFCNLASSTRDASLLEFSGSDGNYTAIGKRNQNGIDSMVIYQKFKREGYQ